MSRGMTRPKSTAETNTPKLPKLPNEFGCLTIGEDERTPLVVQLLEIIGYLSEENQKLKDEIAILKGEKSRPKIKPSSAERAGKGEIQRLQGLGSSGH